MRHLDEVQELVLHVRGVHPLLTGEEIVRLVERSELTSAVGKVALIMDESEHLWLRVDPWETPPEEPLFPGPI